MPNLLFPHLNFENSKFGNWHKLAKIGCPPPPPPPHDYRPLYPPPLYPPAAGIRGVGMFFVMGGGGGGILSFFGVSRHSLNFLVLEFQNFLALLTAHHNFKKLLNYFLISNLFNYEYFV